METAKKYARVILNIIIPIVTIWFVCVWGPRILVYFLPFVIGWIIAMIANPLVRFLERRVRIVRKHSSVLIVIVVLAGVITGLYFLIYWLVMQALELAKQLPDLYNAVNLELQLMAVKFSRIFNLFPESIQKSWLAFTDNVGSYIGVLVQKAASPTVEVAGSVAKGIPNALVHVVITILSSYFFIAERERIMEFWQRYMPAGVKRYIDHLRKDVRHLIGGYFLAQLKIMLVVAIILCIGFVVLGVNYSVLLAILIAILDFLPLFGTGTVLIPWALYQLLSGNLPMAAGLALLYVLTQVVRQIVQPKIVGDMMGIPPLMTLLILYIGFKVQGLLGMILAVPVSMVILSLYQYGSFNGLIENVKILIDDINEFRKGGK